MAGIDEFKRQQDLVFQQIEEKEKLARQAKETKIADAMKSKRDIAGIAKSLGISTEEARKMLEQTAREVLDSDSI